MPPGADAEEPVSQGGGGEARGRAFAHPCVAFGKIAAASSRLLQYVFHASVRRGERTGRVGPRPAVIESDRMARPKPGEGFWGALKHAFAIPSGPSLTDRERQWLEAVARKVVQRGLTAPALIVLESARPLNYVGSQVLVFFRPIISLVVAPERCDEAAALLEKRGCLKALVGMIERCDRESRAGRGAGGQEA